ncbi:unnamed protein product [Phytophthora lilii]|uniref:Unnamed protein product n=1 Tax=Phytophthora lilii TaxID=2077276 RepID=A0A9W6X3S2_9STRA|nr:unnamed protein product [Phytophthora lilii]
MVKLFCAIVGVAGSAFSVRVDESDSVDDLKKAIKVEKPNDFKDVNADKLQPFLAKKKDGGWLDGAGLAGVTLDEAGAPVSRDESGAPQGFKKMDPLLWVNNDKHFGKNFRPAEGDVHVLVVVPDHYRVNIGGTASRALKYKPKDETPLQVQRQEMTDLTFAAGVQHQELTEHTATEAQRQPQQQQPSQSTKRNRGRGKRKLII